MIRSASKLAWLLALVATWLLMLGRTNAQTPAPEDRDLARSLGHEAQAAFDRHDYTRAEEQASRALERYRAATLYLLRGRARQGLGKLSAAIEDYEAALALPQSPNENHFLQRARSDARGALESARAQVAHLTLVAKAPVHRVLLNGVEWPLDRLGVDRELDPGLYAIEVVAPHAASRLYHTALAAGQRQVLQLEPPAAPEPPAAESVRPKLVLPDVPLQPAPVKPAADHTLAYVLGATTLSLAIASVVTGFVSLDRRATYNENNRADVPLSTVRAHRSDAQTWAWLNTGLWASTVVAGAATGYVLFLAPDASSETGISGLQLVAAGRF